MPPPRRTIPQSLVDRYLSARQAADPGSPNSGEPDTPAGQKFRREVERLRERLVAAGRHLAVYGANAVCPYPPPPLTRDDVLSFAMEGLLTAVDTYQTGRGARFQTYAISKVRWAVLDGLRKEDPLPRTTRVPVARAEDSRNRLSAELGRTPTASEVAHKAGLTPAKLDDLSLRVLGSRALPLDNAQASPGANAPRGDGQPRALHETVADEAAADPGYLLAHSELRELLLGKISALGERDGLIVFSYFYRGLTLKEIGTEVGLTEGRISQIMRDSLGSLRYALRDTLGDTLGDRTSLAQPPTRHRGTPGGQTLAPTPAGEAAA